MANIKAGGRNLEDQCNFSKLLLVDTSNSQPPDEFAAFQPNSNALDQIPTPNNPPWNGWVAIGVFLMSVLLVLLVPAIFVLPYIISQGNFADNAEFEKFVLSDPTVILIQLVAIIPVHLLTLGIAWMVVTKANRYSFFKTLGWKSGGVRWWHYIVLVLGFFTLAAVVNYVYPLQESDFDRMLKSSQSTLLVVAFLATFTAPFIEEVVYRGIMYSAFQRTFGVPLAVAGVTFLFLAVHVFQYRQSPSTILLIASLSLMLTLTRAYSNNLWPCVVLHTIFNGLQALYLVIRSYLPNAELPAEQTATILRHLN